MVELMEVVKTFGLPTALVVYFIIQNQKRQNKQDVRLQSIEDFCRGELLECTKKSSEINAECLKAIEENTKAMHSATEIMTRTVVSLERFDDGKK
jgi:hypothetical protein